MIDDVEKHQQFEEEILALFPPYEGQLCMYYGKIGNGKTYNATADVLDLLRRGQVVYVNWKIHYEGYDERQSLAYSFMRWLFFRRVFFRFGSENLHYFSPDDVDVDFLSSLTDCHVFIDEGQWIFDSYEGTKFSKTKRRLILHTRHYNRSLNIISQRTQAIQVTARGQVNRFYKCVKKLSWPFLIFQRIEFQEMKDQDVDETKPESKKTYFASKSILNAYISSYLRGDVQASQKLVVDKYDIDFWGRTKLFLVNFWRALKRTPKSPVEIGAPAGDNSIATALKSSVGSTLQTEPEGIVKVIPKGVKLIVKPMKDEEFDRFTSGLQTLPF